MHTYIMHLRHTSVKLFKLMNLIKCLFNNFTISKLFVFVNACSSFQRFIWLYTASCLCIWCLSGVFSCFHCTYVCNRWTIVTRPGLETRAFRWPCEHSTTELPSHPVISPTTFHIKPTPVTCVILYTWYIVLLHLVTLVYLLSGETMLIWSNISTEGDLS